MDLTTTVGKIDALLANLYSSYEVLSVFEQNNDVKEAIGRVSLATNSERSNTDPIFIEECYSKASTDLSQVLATKKDLPIRVRNILEHFEVLVNRHLRDICVLSEANVSHKNPLFYEKMEKENEELHAQVIGLQLHAEELKVHNNALLAERDVRIAEQQKQVPPTFVPEVNHEQVELEVSKRIKQLQRAKTIAKEIRDMDEKWINILRGTSKPTDTTSNNNSSTKERVLKSQSMFNLSSKES